MSPSVRLVTGLLTANGVVHNDDDQDLESIAEDTLRRCEKNDKSLRALDLSNTLFTSLFLLELSTAMTHNTKLIELHLDNCRLGDEGTRLLANGLAANKSHSVKVLSLESNQIHCHGASYIAKLMEERSARWTRTFGGYKAPSAGPGFGLTFLSLKANEIAAIGAKALAEVLMSGDDSLKTLGLAENKIDDWGVGWLSMALRNHGALQCLCLEGNPIGPDGIEEIKRACVTAKAKLTMLSKKGEETLVQLSEKALKNGPMVYLSEASSPTVSAASSRPSSAARSRPSSAARSRPSSAAMSRISSAQSFAGSVASCSYRRPGSASRKVPITLRRPTTDAKDTGTAVKMRLVTAQEFNKDGKPNPHWPPHPSRLSCSRDHSKEPITEPTTFNLSTLNAASARIRASERGVGANEAEHVTILSSPTHWRRKPRSVCDDWSHGSRGCGYSAARNLRRSCSMPGPSRRFGSLMGPSAAMAMAS